jgi:hypothetical protein
MDGKIVMLSLLFFSVAHASPQEHARKLQQQTQRIAQTTSPRAIPGFTTATPPESSLNDHHALESATSQAFTSNDAADFLRRSAETRPYFRIDLENDSLIENSEASVQDPEAILAGPLENREPLTKYEIVLCQESKPKTELKCAKNLLPPEFDVTPAKYSHYWCAVGRHRPDDASCQAKTYYNPARMYEPEKVHIQKEIWTSTCQTLEEKERLGLCRLIKKECPGGSETRDVVGKMGDKAVTRPITRDCWRYELTYSCAHPSPNTCEALRQAGCEQIKSTCLTKIGDVCVEWKQTFRCPTQKRVFKRKISRAPYRLPRIPLPTQEAPNNDMAEAISKLQILQETQDELRVGGEATSLPLIFKGRSCACTIAFAGFKNCCTDGKGWGVSLGLSGCDGEDKDLAERQQKGLCHEVGTYCAEKVLGVCIRKKRRYCCFPSKLSRILHEQARPQIGLGWGSPEEAQCRGFTADELSQINFDRLDLREVYAEVAARMKEKSAGVVQRNLSDRVSQMTHSLKNKPAEGGL